MDECRRRIPGAWGERHSRCRTLQRAVKCVEAGACRNGRSSTRYGRQVSRPGGAGGPVVVYSCTSSSPEDAPRGMAFLYDPHRFNVATSRARSTMIVVASSRLFERDCRTSTQMAWANGFC